MKKRTLSPSAQNVTDVQMTLKSSENTSVDFGRIAEQMECGNMTPKEISDARNLVAAYLSRMRWVMGQLAARRALFVNKNRESYRSIAETERAWESTDAGQQEVTLHHQIRGLEQLSGALETNWFLLQGETKGRY